MKSPQYPDSRHLIEVRSAGAKGQGIFATSPIKMGTRVLAEQALISAPKCRKTEYPDVLQSFRNLPGPQKHLYMTHFQPHVSVGLQIDVKEAFRRDWKDMPWEDRQVLARWEANCFIRYGVSFLTCKFNHSCIPNLHWAVNEETRCITFQANKDIAEGEELTITYTSDNNIEPTDERMNALWNTWGFECTCEACLDTDEAEEMDKIRMTLKDFEKVMTEERNGGNYDGAVEIGERGLELSKDLPNEYTLHMMLVLSNTQFEAKNMKAARFWASRWMILAEVCLGMDHPHCRRMLHFVQTLKTQDK